MRIERYVSLVLGADQAAGVVVECCAAHCLPGVPGHVQHWDVLQCKHLAHPGPRQFRELADVVARHGVDQAASLAEVSPVVERPAGVRKLPKMLIAQIDVHVWVVTRHELAEPCRLGQHHGAEARLAPLRIIEHDDVTEEIVKREQARDGMAEIGDAGVPITDGSKDVAPVVPGIDVVATMLDIGTCQFVMFDFVVLDDRAELAVRQASLDGFAERRAARLGIVKEEDPPAQLATPRHGAVTRPYGPHASYPRRRASRANGITSASLRNDSRANMSGGRGSSRPMRARTGICSTGMAGITGADAGSTARERPRWRRCCWCTTFGRASPASPASATSCRPI